MLDVHYLLNIFIILQLGGMLAGHDQSGGEIIVKDGKKVRHSWRFNWIAILLCNSLAETKMKILN